MAQNVSQEMGALLQPGARLTPAGWIERIVLALAFTGTGGLIWLVFSPYRPWLKGASDQTGRLILILALGAAVWLLRRNGRTAKYAPVFLGLWIMAVAISVDRWLGVYLIQQVGVSDKAPAGWAVLKVSQLIIVPVVLLLTLAAGGSLGSIYVHKGRLKLGLGVGLITFTLAAAGSVTMANEIFAGRELTAARIAGWLPYLLVFVFANAIHEELLFRGLHLRKLEPFFGRFLSSLMVALVFTVIHQAVDYTTDKTVFLAATFLLALAWGWLMQKSDAVWGSILFHAGMDLPIMLGIFSNL
jgi:uncharacterized protein